MRPHARVEAFQPEINRVRAILDGGFRAFPIARRREQFRTRRRRQRFVFADWRGWVGDNIRHTVVKYDNRKMREDKA